MVRRLVLTVIAAVVACGSSSGMAGVEPAPSSPPAETLLSMAQASSLRDFHLTYAAHLWAEGPLSTSGGSISVLRSGQGNVSVTPTLTAALHETDTFCADRCPIDMIVVGESRYTKSPSSSWWLERGVPLDSYLWSLILPSSLAKASRPRVAGQQTLDGAATWVIDANSSDGHLFRVWLRKQDGYPVQLESAPHEKTSFLDLRIKLDGFNRGLAIKAPRQDQLDPRFWGTEYIREHPIPFQGGTVTIHQAGYDCDGASTYDDSRPDVYPVLVPFTYAAGSKPLVIDPGAWTLYDTFGHPYRGQSLGIAPKLEVETVSPGHSASGDLCFLVPWAEDNLTIVGDFRTGVVTSFVGGLRRPDSTTL